MEELAHQLGRYGVPLVFLNVLAEQAGLPIPATPILVLGGALAANGEMSASLILLTALAASVLADVVWYALGRRQGRRILKQICRLSLSPESCVRQTEHVFHRYGISSIVLAKFIPGFSTVAPPLAGAMGVRVLPFLIATSGSALLWAGASLGIGWIFHRQLSYVADWLESLGFWGLVFLGVALVGFIGLKIWRRKRFYRMLRMARITAAELNRLLSGNQETMVFDVRTDGGRRTDPRRIPGAKVLHADDSEELDRKLADLPRGRDIVLYCT